ncbi:MAG: oxidoreductase, partial [Clostridiaceae bacterium]|nr:oxidoreductase [Clostridiaceae bacterium]
MIYKKFKDILLSRLGMGNMRLPTKKVQSGTVIDKNKAQQIIDYAMNNGINYYDTAYMYHNGESEEFLGEALKKYDRSSYYLATKFNINANPDYKAVFEEQLSKLQTDYIDFYLIHSLSDSTMQRYIDEGSVNYFIEQKRAGKIKFLGFSTHASVGTLEKFADYADWDFAQMQLNYFDWLYSHTKAEYQALKQRDIPIVVMEPVRGGRLATLS